MSYEFVVLACVATGSNLRSVKPTHIVDVSTRTKMAAPMLSKQGKILSQYSCLYDLFTSDNQAKEEEEDFLKIF